MSAERIEEMYAKKYNTTTTSRKDIGDIYVDGVPINIKSNNVNKNNYSPNLVSAEKLFDHLSDSQNKLKFMFVDYEQTSDGVNILNETLVDAEHVSWDCLKIQAQGRGVIQVNSARQIDENQTREKFLAGFKSKYQDFISREKVKLEELNRKFGNG